MIRLSGNEIRHFKIVYYDILVLRLNSSNLSSLSGGAKVIYLDHLTYFRGLAKSASDVEQYLFREEFSMYIEEGKTITIT